MHSTFRADPDRLYRARVLIALLLSFNVVLVLACAANQAVDSPRWDRLVNLALTGSLLLGNSALLIALRRRGSYFFCGASAVLLTAASVVVSIGLAGGIWHSPVALLLAVPVLMAYYFGGVRWGNPSVLICGAIVLGFLLAEYAGLRFPPPPSANLLTITHLVIALVCIAAVAIMAYVYEFTASTLKGERDRNHRKAVALAQTDVLTGLFNRRSFDARLQQRIAAHALVEPARPLVLCYLDLDAFKSINDRYGHAVGDEVLQNVAERLHAAVRGSDIVGRHGGDEFMILLDSAHTDADVEIMAQRTLASIRTPIHTRAGALSVGASLGFAIFPRDADSLEALKKAADTAMYAAKRSGGSGWHIGPLDIEVAAPKQAPGDAAGSVVDGGRAAAAPAEIAEQAAPVESWSALIDHFVHPALRRESDTLHRARILSMALLLMLIVVAACCIVVATVELPLITKIANLSITGSVVLIAAFLLAKLRRSGAYFYCSAATVLLLLTGNFIGICISGGVAAAPATALMAIPTLVAYFFAGLRWGTYVAFAAAAAILMLAAAEAMGLQFYNTSDISHATFNQLLVNIMGLAVMSGMAFIYEFTTAALMRERDAEHEKVNRLAYTDALTGLANRLDFDTELTVRIARYDAAITHTGFALCLLDLDGFKPINDRFGHDVGDQVLQTISERLRDCLRDADYVGRQGGDEFMLIFDAVTNPVQVDIFAKRVLRMVELPIRTSAGAVSVSGSLGFALFPSGASEINALKGAADRAMYVAKRQRSGWCVDGY